MTEIKLIGGALMAAVINDISETARIPRYRYINMNYRWVLANYYLYSLFKYSIVSSGVFKIIQNCSVVHDALLKFLLLAYTWAVLLS